MAPSDGLTDNRSGGIREQLYEEMVVGHATPVAGPEFKDLVLRELPQQRPPFVPKTGHDVFKAMPKDNVVQPQHYSRFKIQPLEFVLVNGLGYVEGNVIKYVCRWRFKNGVEDLKKAREFLDKYITRIEAGDVPLTDRS